MLRIILIILAVLVALFLCLFFLCPVGLRLTAHGETDFGVYLRVGFVDLDLKKRLFGEKKPKKAKIVRYAGGSFGAVEESPPKKKKKNKAAAPSHASKPKAPKSPLETAAFFRDLLVETLSRFFRYTKFTVKKLRFIAASPSPDTTAYLFGAFNAAASALLTLGDRCRTVRADREQIGVYSDFLADRPAFDADIRASIKPYQAALVGLAAYRVYRKR